MAKRGEKKKSQGSLGVLVDLAHTINDTFEALTGKPIPVWLEEFRQRPKELPGEQYIPGQPVMPLSDAYAVLGLTPDASPEQVKTHYRNLARVFHSDVGAAMNDEAMKLLNRAHDRITKAGK
ncbi:hypothetical protein LCGC14_2907780 [marine sediment metagenome]|uniref:J domain-containing protein n=1 Tax=marine sediment metagenome TaxID=412755 RepID=A0A0F8XSY4_9ZZZZ